MPSTPTSPKTTRVWTASQLDELLAGRPEAPESGPTMPVRWPNVGLAIDHPGGSTAHGLAAVWQIGARAVRLFWKGYLHPGTRCVLDLRAHDGKPHAVAATVETCSHVNGLIHELCLAIDAEQPGGAPFDLCQFAPTADLRNRIAAMLAERERLRGVAIVVGGDGSTSMMIEQSLSRAGLTVERLGRAAETIQRVTVQPPPDICIVDRFTADNSCGVELIGEIRQRTVSLPLALVTMDAFPDDAPRLSDLPYLKVLERPFDRFELLNLVREMLRAGESAQPGGVLTNALREDPDIVPVLNRFVETIPETVTRLQHDCLRGPLSALVHSLRKLAEDSMMVGYYLLGESVKQAWIRAEQAENLAEAREIAEPVIGLLKRLRRH